MLAFVALLLALFLLAQSCTWRNTESRRIYALGIAGVVITMGVQNVTASIFEALANAIFFYTFMGILFSFLPRKKEGCKRG